MPTSSAKAAACPGSDRLSMSTPSVTTTKARLPGSAPYRIRENRMPSFRAVPPLGISRSMLVRSARTLPVGC